MPWRELRSPTGFRALPGRRRHHVHLMWSRALQTTCVPATPDVKRKLTLAGSNAPTFTILPRSSRSAVDSTHCPLLPLKRHCHSAHSVRKRSPHPPGCSGLIISRKQWPHRQLGFAVGV